MKEINREIGKLNPSENVKIVTILEGEGLGTKAIYKDGEVYMTDGDKAFFDEFKSNLPEIIKTKQLQYKENLLFIEVLNPDNKAVIFGAGHVSLPVIRLLKELDMHITVYDDREGFDQLAYDAGADEVIIGDFKETTKAVKGDDNTYFIIVTRGHLSDEVCLKEVINEPFAYLGMIGSRHRIRHYHERFLNEGYTEEQWQTIHTPIGLAIKAKTPFEIAISILAEIIEVKNSIVTERGYITEITKVMNENPDDEFVMATVIERRGSAPRDVGAKMLVTPEEEFYGTVGGGKMERRVLDEAKEVMETSSPLFHFHDMTNVEAWEDSSVCGGKMRVFIEKL